MRKTSQEKVFSEVKSGSADALEILAARSPEVQVELQRQARALGLSFDGLATRKPLDLKSFARTLRRTTFRTLRQQIVQLGDELAARDVRIDHFVSAIHGLAEACLSNLPPNAAVAKLALARFHGLVVSVLVHGHSSQREKNVEALASNLHDAEHRLHDASAYVTKVYERERRRLSHDLHDEVGHDLILLKLYLEMLALDANKDQFRALRPKLEEGLALVSHAIQSVRRIVLDLGPAIFDELGFLPAVKYYVRQFSSRTGINVNLTLGDIPDALPLTHQVAVYRLLQGALSNVLKHAKAKNISVSIGTMRARVLIMVMEDDGVGFDAIAAKGSFGLTAMRERAEVLSGRFHIESNRAGMLSRKHGTRIEVDLPLPSTEAERVGT